MTIASSARLGMAMRFDVVIDGYNLGSWSSCTGLSVDFVHEQVKELGEHTTCAWIPGRVTYPKVSLKRALSAGDWERTKGWLEIVAQAPWLSTLEAPISDIPDGSMMGQSSASITLRDAHLAEVATWTLDNAMPASWKGPSLDANGNAVAVETLELVHEGFLQCATS